MLFLWDKYAKEHLDENMHNKISNGNVVFELLKDTYDCNSEKGIFKKMCKLISPTHKRTEGRAPVWGSEFTSKRRRTTGGIQQKPLLG